MSLDSRCQERVVDFPRGPNRGLRISKARKQEWRSTLMERQEERCFWCRRRFTDNLYSTFDHLVPRSHGGANWIENLVLACAVCNTERGSAKMEDYSTEMEGRQMTTRLDVRDQVVCCNGCGLSKCSTPVPFSGPTPTRFAVLGEAPGREENERGEPFVGKSGQLLRRCMEKAGLDVAQFALLNAVSCFPQKDGKGRTPTPQEVEACSGNREAQLALTNARYVLLTGNIPLQVYRPDLRIGRAHGVPFERDGRVYMPVYHPAAALRNPQWEVSLEDDLRLFRTVSEDSVWYQHIPVKCVWCGKIEEDMNCLHIDDDGFNYCEGCWPRRPVVSTS